MAINQSFQRMSLSARAENAQFVPRQAELASFLGHQPEALARMPPIELRSVPQFSRWYDCFVEYQALCRSHRERESRIDLSHKAVYMWIHIGERTQEMGGKLLVDAKQFWSLFSKHAKAAYWGTCRDGNLEDQRIARSRFVGSCRYLAALRLECVFENFISEHFIDDHRVTWDQLLELAKFLLRSEIDQELATHVLKVVPIFADKDFTTSKFRNELCRVAGIPGSGRPTGSQNTGKTLKRYSVAEAFKMRPKKWKF